MPLQQFIDALEAFSAQRGLCVFRTPLSPGVHGRMDANQIVLRRGLNKKQQLLTLVHELTHFLAHRPDAQLNRTVCEYEAEAVEKWVAWELGLEEPGAAIDLHTFTDDLLACSVTRVRWVAQTLLTAVREQRPAYGAGDRLQAQTAVEIQTGPAIGQTGLGRRRDLDRARIAPASATGAGRRRDLHSAR